MLETNELTMLYSSNSRKKLCMRTGIMQDWLTKYPRLLIAAIWITLSSGILSSAARVGTMFFENIGSIPYVFVKNNLLSSEIANIRSLTMSWQLSRISDLTRLLSKLLVSVGSEVLRQISTLTSATFPFCKRLTSTLRENLSWFLLIELVRS